MSYLEKRRNRWYAVLTIPADVRHRFEGKIRFVKSTEQTDKTKAKLIAMELVSGWKRRIEHARNNPVDLDFEFALSLKEEIEAAGSADSPIAYGAYDYLDRLVLEGQGERADKIAKIISPKNTVLELELMDWESGLNMAPRSHKQIVSAAKEVVDYFPTTADVTHERIREWAKHLLKPSDQGGAGLSKSSIERRFKAARSLWRHLQDQGKVSPDQHPFVLPSFVTQAEKSKARRRLAETGNKNSRVPFDPAEVVRLRHAAVERGDQILADLIALGMYTGARIEELCSLECKFCSSTFLKVTKSKTEAGYREIPVHDDLVPVVERLLSSSEDGYLLSGLVAPKSSGDRSSAIGKRFGRLKKSMGFPSSKVFHSIRKTLTTLLEDAGVSENLAADIVGHDKPRITYGIYSGGASFETKKDALNKVKYPKLTFAIGSS